MNRQNLLATRNVTVGISYSDLLLKNLRLHDLDEEFDWPNINTSSFAATDNVKNLNKRLYNAAWILYKLFEIYDPEKTRRELRDLFPPLEPKQSSLLRSAMFKRLHELKSNGYFGKDIVVRKTMFDDCKGPKFEELLAIFSSAVLIKVIQTDKKDRSAVKAAIGVPQLNIDVVSLTLAYKASLRMQLRSREMLERRWAKFSRTLENQKASLEQRAQLIQAKSILSPQKRIPQRTVARLRRHLSENWNGDDDWIDILLHSDQHRATGLLPETPYSSVWGHACEDTLYAMRPCQNHSRLQTFESRVVEQRARLDRWKATQTAICAIKRGQQAVSKPATMQAMAIPPQRYALRANSSGRPAKHSRETDNMTVPVTEIKREAKHRRSRSAVETSDPKDTSFTSIPKGSVQKPLANTGMRISSATQSYRPHTSYAYTDRLLPSRHGSTNPDDSFAILDNEHYLNEEDVKDELENIVIESSGVKDTIGSILNSKSPSHQVPLTLAERTRISMVTMGTKPFGDPGTSRPQNKVYTYEASSPTTPTADQDDLAERTRKSMVIKNSVPNASAATRRSSRSRRTSAVYPVNQFETPRKPVMADELLFDETTINLDEEDIFKSRPKVAVSPVLSPMAEVGNLPSIGVATQDESYEDDFS